MPGKGEFQATKKGSRVKPENDFNAICERFPNRGDILLSHRTIGTLAPRRYLGYVLCFRMRRDEAIASLKQCKQQLAALGVRGLYLFGSVARDQATVGSDIDLLVEPADGYFTIFDLGLVREVLLRELKSPVDVHDYGGYVRLPSFRANVGSDIVRVF